MKARPWVWLLLVFALLATACGGEVDESADDGDETEAVDDAPAEDNETAADEPEPETEEDPAPPKPRTVPTPTTTPEAASSPSSKRASIAAIIPSPNSTPSVSPTMPQQMHRQPTTASRPTR